MKLSIHAARIACDIDTAPLMAAIDARPELWKLHTQRQEFPNSPHSQTETIFLRLPENAAARCLQSDLDAEPTPVCLELAPVLEPILSPLLKALAVERFGRATIVRLPPGKQVAPHIDQGAYAKAYSRFHLVLRCSPGFFLMAGEEVHEMATGECWWLDHRHLHGSCNAGGGDRVAIIFDVQTPLFTPGGQDEP